MGGTNSTPSTALSKQRSAKFSKGTPEKESVLEIMQRVEGLPKKGMILPKLEQPSGQKVGIALKPVAMKSGPVKAKQPTSG